MAGKVHPHTYLHCGWANNGFTEAALPANLKFSCSVQLGVGVQKRSGRSHELINWQAEAAILTSPSSQ